MQSSQVKHLIHSLPNANKDNGKKQVTLPSRVTSEPQRLKGLGWCAVPGASLWQRQRAFTNTLTATPSRARSSSGSKGISSSTR